MGDRYIYKRNVKHFPPQGLIIVLSSSCLLFFFSFLLEFFFFCCPAATRITTHIYTAAHPTRTAQLHAPPHTCAQRAAARDACGESDCMVMHA
jgi:hypothetical protein